jgi:hypothetical protein
MPAKETQSCCELKKHKPWFNKRCSNLLDQGTQAKFQWLQDPSKIKWDNLKNIRCEASRRFRNKKKENLKGKIMSLQRTGRAKTSETCIEE